MWKDVVEYLLTKTNILHSEALREPIMRMFDGDKLREGVAEEVTARLRGVLEDLVDCEFDLHRAAFHKFVMSRRPRNE